MVQHLSKNKDDMRHASMGDLKSILKRLERFWEAVEAYWRRLEASGRRLEASWKRPGGVLGEFFPVLEARSHSLSILKQF